MLWLLLSASGNFQGKGLARTIVKNLFIVIWGLPYGKKKNQQQKQHKNQTNQKKKNQQKNHNIKS